MGGKQSTALVERSEESPQKTQMKYEHIEKMVKLRQEHKENIQKSDNEVRIKQMELKVKQTERLRQLEKEKQFEHVEKIWAEDSKILEANAAERDKVLLCYAELVNKVLEKSTTSESGGLIRPRVTKFDHNVEALRIINKLFEKDLLEDSEEAYGQMQDISLDDVLLNVKG